MADDESVASMNNERRLQRARVFDEIAELYDQARRDPPDQLFTNLFALAGIEPAGASVLEIGCGTGQATLPLARRGCRVVCVEMGANLARIARRKLSPFTGVEIVNVRFEDWEPNGVFDMVLAVTSWHWIDPQLRYAKAAAVLRAAGVLAFTTGCHAFPPGFDTFFAEIQTCYRAIGETGLKWPPPLPEEIPDAREDIERSGYFDDVRVERFLGAEEFTADEYVELMSTASDHRLMEPAKREHLFGEMRRLIAERPGGRVRKHILTILHVARKIR
jgi:SAM-dependent methyltransferase